MNNKTTVAIVVFAVVAGGGISWYIRSMNAPQPANPESNQQPGATDNVAQPSPSQFSDADAQTGWYYGQLKDKRPGTPDRWQHQLEGTRGARWYDPAKFPVSN